MNGLKKKAENRVTQWHAKSAHCMHTNFTLRENVSSVNAPRKSQLFTFGPGGGAGYCTERGKK